MPKAKEQTDLKQKIEEAGGELTGTAYTAEPDWGRIVEKSYWNGFRKGTAWMGIFMGLLIMAGLVINRFLGE